MCIADTLHTLMHWPQPSLQLHSPSITHPAPCTHTSQDVAKQMPKEQVIRRLRALGQPVTLFGEDDYMRFRRLQKAEKEHKVADEALGAELPQNTMLHVQRQEKAQKKADKGKDKDKDKVCAGAALPAASCIHGRWPAGLLACRSPMQVAWMYVYMACARKLAAGAEAPATTLQCCSHTLHAAAPAGQGRPGAGGPSDGCLPGRCRRGG
jgi:hypothetical protein